MLKFSFFGVIADSVKVILPELRSAPDWQWLSLLDINFVNTD